MREPSHIKLRVVGITQAEGQIPKIAFKKYKCVMIFMANTRYYLNEHWSNTNAPPRL